MTKAIDEKQKKKMIDAIIEDFPHLGKDNLQYYYMERMVESYLLDPDTFNRQTTNAIKQEKKAKKEGQQPQPFPEEIVCISKIETEEESPMKDVVVS
jgi:hypothetical protein